MQCREDEQFLPRQVTIRSWRSSVLRSSSRRALDAEDPTMQFS
jgi:hypothetical protein